MTVEKLIKQLKTCPKKAQVLIESVGNHESFQRVAQVITEKGNHRSDKLKTSVILIPWLEE